MNRSMSVQNVKRTVIYSDIEIAHMTESYFKIHRGLWEYMPVGSHVRFVKRGDEDRNERFKPGGFIKNHFESPTGKKMIMLENRRGGATHGAGYIKFPIALEEIDEIWKKYDIAAFVEIHVIFNSLARKDKQLKDLKARVEHLEKIIKKATGKKPL